MKIAPGATSAWYIQTGRSVSGLWATPGLELTLDQDLDGVGRTVAVTGPAATIVGETITIVERRGQGRANQATVLPATFEAPARASAGRHGAERPIAGQVTAPRLSETSQFNTATESRGRAGPAGGGLHAALWLDRFVNALRMYFDEERWLLVTIGALLAWCILAGVTAIVFRIGHAEADVCASVGGAQRWQPPMVGMKGAQERMSGRRQPHHRAAGRRIAGVAGRRLAIGAGAWRAMVSVVHAKPWKRTITMRGTVAPGTATC